ncbi:hypothetical protein L1049_020530 [Liquidambar formosana]|uniref:ADP-ribosyl cyclase/cyclic ADP-ribose hydrolase n=1 Tax=Liquidambar formosana TaxID=63359 RepID=A0AAP0X632_LIQFO
MAACIVEMDCEGNRNPLGREYEVFLSFCGDDTRKGFADMLYHDLDSAEIRTFRDSEKLHVGKAIGSELLKAIRESKISISIFSKNYASRKWCLRELVQMVECQKEPLEQKIFPIFYDVKPDDVKHQTRSYEEAFCGHTEVFDENTIHGWKRALREVGYFKGWELDKETKGHEGELIKKIVSKVCMVGVEEESHVSVDAPLLKFNPHDKLLVDERLLQMGAAGSDNLSTFPAEREIFCRDDNKSRTSVGWVPEMSHENLEGMDAATDTTVLQFKNCGGGGQGRDAGFSEPGSSVGLVANMKAETVELIGMTFCKKPPTIDWTDGIENALLLPTIPNRPFCRDEESYEGTSGRASDKFLPFFGGDCQEEKDFHDNCYGNTEFNFHQEAIMGVPTHYLNNGSCLYLLTPVFSPPSADCVHKWLFHNERGVSTEKFNGVSVEPSSLKGSSGSLIGSQGFMADACNKPLPESVSVSHVKPILHQLNQQNHGNINAEMNHFCNEVTTLPQREGNITKVKECNSSSQDISQISGPDGKSKPTPLSQIGFRDPASVGGGKQLTLLSIEVLAESRGDLWPDPQFDAIHVITVAIQDDDDSIPVVYVLLRSDAGSYHRMMMI